MPSSGYTAITFVANEQPTTAKWNLIGSNDSSFNLGTGLEDGVILNRHMATLSVKDTNIDHATFNWAADRTGIVNTAAAGGFGFTALNGGLTLVVPVINGAKYMIEIGATFVAPSVNTQNDLRAQIAGVDIIDTIATNANAGIIGSPHFGRKLYTATSTGNITIVCGVSAGSANTMRTDAYTISVRRIA